MTGGWGSITRCPEGRMFTEFPVWCMIQLLQELLYGTRTHCLGHGDSQHQAWRPAQAVERW